LLKNATALERLAEIDTVIFDKTGTLTRQSFDPDRIDQADLEVLKALALASDHPLARAIVASLPDVKAAPLDEVREEAGFGVRARHDGRPVALGAGRAFDCPDRTVFWRDGVEPVPLDFGETALPDSADMIAKLHAQGFATILLSGDSPERAQRIASELGIAEVRAGMSPDGKLALVSDLAQAGHRVLMVGDGLNDTAALARAHASIAPSSALEASRNAADAVLLGGDVSLVPTVLAEARTARTRMAQNVWLAGLYNIIAVPVAMAGFVTPLIAAIAMSASSITVIGNAMRKGAKT
jgi:Cu2+-exporting ATPase